MSLLDYHPRDLEAKSMDSAIDYEAHAKIELQTKEFLSKGGKIQEVPDGASAYSFQLETTKYNNGTARNTFVDKRHIMKSQMDSQYKAMIQDGTRNKVKH